MQKKLFNLSTGIPLEDAPLVYLHEHFKKHNNPNRPHLQNNWVWYHKDDLNAIIDMIEKIKDGDGVRIYYGIYNEEVCKYISTLTGNDYTNHIGHNTVLFVPTYEGSGKDEHIDSISKESAGQLKKNYEAGVELPHPAIGGYNVGNICPPPPTGKPDCKGSGSHLDDY